MLYNTENECYFWRLKQGGRTLCKVIPVRKDISVNMTVVSTYQIKSIYIDNFKAFNEFSMDFSPMTILVGNNSSGKSSVLQALVFLKYCCERTTGEAVEQRILPHEDLQRLRKS